MFNPFGMGSARQGFGQQGFNQPYDFKGLESRLGKIETGIAGLTDQFKSFPGQETVDPAYTGNTAPDPLTTAAPTGGIQSLPEAQPAQASGQELSRSGPLSLTEKLRNEYLMGSAVGDLAGIGAPVTMGGEWDARAKEMGFDFRKQVRQLDSGEWAGTGQGADHFNQLFEEAGGVLDRPQMGAAARYGEGFTNWLGDKGYEVYTEPQQEWMTQKQGLAGAGDLGFGQDTSGYIPHLSQYAMTAEEMQDPTGTLAARRLKLYQPSAWGDEGGISGFEELERLRGGKLDQDLNNLSGWQQQQGIPGMQQGIFGGRPNDLEQPIGGPTREQQYQQLQAQSQALQAGVGALQGPTQQKIQQGIGALV